MHRRPAPAADPAHISVAEGGTDASGAPPSRVAGAGSVAGILASLMVAVLVAFLVIGLALPVLPLHVRDDLGFGPFVVGVVTGSQFVAALLARVWAGRCADAFGPKRAVLVGLAAAAGAGLLYLASLGATVTPSVAVAWLLAGRALLGAAESFVITGATTWGLARAGAANAGKTIAWMGTAMFAGFAIGAPLGTALFHVGAFGAVALATAAAPLAALAVVLPMRGSAGATGERPALLSVVARIWLPGLGAALSSVGFGTILAFGSLLYAEHAWSPVWLAFTAYALALIATRIAFGHWPDRLGGAQVAILSVMVEAVGLTVMASANGGWLAALGAALTGAGYSLVFPGLGVEAVRLAPSQSRGVAMGAYTACLDLALGVSGPVLGLVATGFGYRWAFGLAALVVLLAAPIGTALLPGRAGSRARLPRLREPGAV